MKRSPCALTKSALGELISERLGCPKAKAAAAVQTVLNIIQECFRRGEKVKIGGFGTFVVQEKGARPGRNLYTGAPVVIAPRRIVRFRSSEKLKARMVHKSASMR